MLDQQYRHRIVRDPKCCGGELRIRGTRVTLRAVLSSLAEGDQPEEIVDAFPSLCLEDVRAAVAFAAASSDEDVAPKPALVRAS